MSRAAQMSPNDREVIVRFHPELSRALDAAALFLRRDTELERAETRQAERGIRCPDAVNAARSRKREARCALRQALVDHWCPPEE